MFLLIRATCNNATAAVGGTAARVRIPATRSTRITASTNSHAPNASRRPFFASAYARSRLLLSYFYRARVPKFRRKRAPYDVPTHLPVQTPEIFLDGAVQRAHNNRVVTRVCAECKRFSLPHAPNRFCRSGPEWRPAKDAGDAYPQY